MPSVVTAEASVSAGITCRFPYTASRSRIPEVVPAIRGDDANYKKWVRSDHVLAALAKLQAACISNIIAKFASARSP